MAANDDERRDTKRDGVIRHDYVLFVDRLETDVPIDYSVIARNSYSLELTEEQARKLYKYLGDRLGDALPKQISIRVIGRLRA